MCISSFKLGEPQDELENYFALERSALQLGQILGWRVRMQNRLYVNDCRSSEVLVTQTT